LILLGFFLIYLVTFKIFYPEINSLEKITIDHANWNKDEDIHTLESYFYYFPHDLNYNKLDSVGQFINHKVQDKKREFTVLNKNDVIYYPSFAAKFVINLFNMQTEGLVDLSDHLDEIELASNFLKEKANYENNTACWRMNFLYHSYDVKINWSSSYQQGLILSALARAFTLSNDSSYLMLGIKAVNFCGVSIVEEGFCNKIDESHYCYEEYPAIPSSSVLNGHIYCLFGLYDFYRATNYQPALDFFNKGINFLIDNIGYYDLGYWSQYDLTSGYAASYSYHKKTHIPQLKALYQITGNEIFNEYTLKWENYYNEPYFTIFKLKALIDAIKRRLFYKTVFTIG
ncbi:D-glucuronyl C5-epimerase family protein, partial [Bacteroidota bacterium]